MPNDLQSNDQDRRQLDIRFVPVGDLLLDGENPRLASLTMTDDPSQMDLMRALWTEMAVDELVLSIAANGYFPEEPLFVVPSPDAKHPGEYIVLEGNRRLAAVRILLDDEYRDKLRITGMPTIDEEQKKELGQLPVSIYRNRQQLWAFLSFRHINTPQEWDAYSKAMYVAKVHDEYQVPLDDIARRIGDRHETVKRMYRGYKVLRQAQHNGVYDVSERYSSKFFFSHWYTALSYSQFQEYLGIELEDFEEDYPVPDTKLGELGQLLTWIYGRKTDSITVEPLVKRQNPDLNNLREVISHPAALDALRAGISLTRSYEISIGDERRFREALVRSKEELQQAKGTVTVGYKGDDDAFDTIQDIRRIAITIQQEMQQIREEANKP